jgi:hypothetical protein
MCNCKASQKPAPKYYQIQSSRGTNSGESLGLGVVKGLAVEPVAGHVGPRISPARHKLPELLGAGHAPGKAAGHADDGQRHRLGLRGRRMSVDRGDVMVTSMAVHVGHWLIEAVSRKVCFGGAAQVSGEASGLHKEI